MTTIDGQIDWWCKRGDAEPFFTQLTTTTKNLNGTTTTSHPDLSNIQSATLLLVRDDGTAGLAKVALEPTGDPLDGIVTFTPDAAFFTACPPAIYDGEVEVIDQAGKRLTWPGGDPKSDDNPIYLLLQVLADLGDGPAS